MKRIFEWLPQSYKRDFWVFIVVPLVVTVIPYGIIWTLWPPQQTREVLVDVRFWMFVTVVFTWILCKIKIRLHEFGFLRNKNHEKKVDKVLTFSIYASGIFLFICYIPILIVLLVVAHYAKQDKMTGRERILTEIFLGLGVIGVVALGMHYILMDRFPLGFIVTISYCSILIVLMWLVYFERKRSNYAKRIIDGAVYILSNVCTSVFGTSIHITGHLKDDVFAIVSNHEGAWEYAAGGWTAILGWVRSKILAGDNLADFPVVGDFISLKTITVKGRRPKRKGKFWAVIKFLQRGTDKIKELLTGKEIHKPEKVVNTSVILQIKACIKEGTFVWITPKGRERVSDNGVLKKISPENLKFVDAVQPVLCLGPMAYKPAGKRELKSLRQGYVSPRKIWVYILEPLFRIMDETNVEFSNRIWMVMTEAKAKRLAEIKAIEDAQKARLDAFKRKVANWFRF